MRRYFHLSVWCFQLAYVYIFRDIFQKHFYKFIMYADLRVASMVDTGGVGDADLGVASGVGGDVGGGVVSDDAVLDVGG